MSEAGKHHSDIDASRRPAYGTSCSVTDYILGITFDIWEEGQVDLILRYYADDVVVYGLDGIVHGAAAMVEQTHATLHSFPGRLLIGDDVVWAGDTGQGYSSHRVYSPMTNLGDTVFGPATGREVRVMNVADCEIRDGLITREWLLRDNLALVSQLGFDPVDTARIMSQRFQPEHREWLAQEFGRVSQADPEPRPAVALPGTTNDAAFAQEVLNDCWVSGDTQRLETVYAPYCVLQRAPVRIVSGRRDLLTHYAAWRSVLPDARLTIDHVCGQPFGADGRHIAVRWSVAGSQQAGLSGCDARGQPLFILGVTHWRVLAGRIIFEWTVFDELALMAQSLSGAR